MVDWRIVMDWVLACSIFVLIIGFIIDIIKSIKNNKTVTSEHNLLSKEHNQISSTIKEQRELLEKDTQQIILQNNRHFDKTSEIERELSRLDRTIFGEIKRREAQLDNLSVRQQEAQKQVETFNFMFEEMSRLQTENTELRLENYKLKEEIKKLIESKEQERHRGIRR